MKNQVIKMRIYSTVEENPGELCDLNFVDKNLVVKLTSHQMRIRHAIYQDRMKGCWYGKAPSFYKRIKNKKGQPTLIPSSDAELLKNAFRDIASGKDSIICIWIFWRAAGKTYSLRNFKKLLSNRAYLGEVKLPAFDGNSFCWIKGLHEALIDEATFESVQQIIREEI